MKTNLKKIMEIKKIGKEKLMLLVLAGIMLIGASYFENGRSEGQTKIRETEYVCASLEDDYGKIMEEKISNMIEGIKGVSKVSVMVTLKSGNEKVVKEDSEDEASQSKKGSDEEKSNSQKKKTVILENDNGESPYVIKEMYPEVEGIAIMASGIGDSSKKEEIIKMLSALFDVPLHKISVVEID